MLKEYKLDSVSTPAASRGDSMKDVRGLRRRLRNMKESEV